MLFLKELRQAFLLTVVLLVVCGFVYPYALTGISHIVFPEKAEGSLIKVNGVPVGSVLIGQEFTDQRFMQGRPSAVKYNTYTASEKADGSYEGVASGSQNLAPSNPALVKRIEEDMATFLAAHPDITAQDIPTDLVTASGSGLDPHISLASAMIQVPTLMEHTGLSKTQLEEIIHKYTTGKFMGIFGEEVVNVLQVNIEIAQNIGIFKTAESVQ